MTEYAHEARVDLADGADPRAPGGAITVALCGHWEHDGPCALAPHHTRAERDGAVLHVRTIFATEPANEPLVRERIEAALARGRLDVATAAAGAPPASHDTSGVRWQLRRSGPSAVRAEESEHARRLATG
jgi:hypothetical protein